MIFSSRIFALVVSLLAAFAMMAYPVLALGLSGLVLLWLAVSRETRGAAVGRNSVDA